jgi:hypothetical protein
MGNGEWGIGNWELGIGNWEVWEAFLYLPISPSPHLPISLLHYLLAAALYSGFLAVTLSLM